MKASANTVVLKEKLLNSIENLPGTDIQEILDFAEFLQTKRYKRRFITSNVQLKTEKDPILKLMGCADVEPFANEIDKELYGE